MIRDSFIFYRSFYEALKELPKDMRVSVYDAICSLALDGEEVDLSGIPKAVFLLIKPQIEANNKRYANGKKAKDKQEASKPEAKQKQTRSKEEANLKQKASEAEPNENEECRMNNVNENVNEEETSKEEEMDAAPSPPSLFESFEAEFVRPLSPIEIDMISQWEKEYNADIIRLALAEGVKNNARSMRYIEVILQAWKQAGARTVDEVRAQIDRKRKPKQSKKELPEWYENQDIVQPLGVEVDDEELKKLQAQLGG